MTTATGRTSVGLLLYRRAGDGSVQVLLGHMGGPFWARKDAAAWSIPKGEPIVGEIAEETARREFREELGLEPPAGDYADLGTVRQRGGKTVRVFAREADLDLSGFAPGTFDLEWPPRSGLTRAFPELDRVEWCSLPRADELLVAAQREFLPRLVQLAKRD